ncbi:MAG: sigma factor-like helix-turn-helix DNA-binding protein [Terriglobales bacterium]
MASDCFPCIRAGGTEQRALEQAWAVNYADIIVRACPADVDGEDFDGDFRAWLASYRYGENSQHHGKTPADLITAAVVRAGHPAAMNAWVEKVVTRFARDHYSPNRKSASARDHHFRGAWISAVTRPPEDEGDAGASKQYVAHELLVHGSAAHDGRPQRAGLVSAGVDDFAAAFRALLARLSPEQRRIVTLAGMGYSFDDIELLTGITATTAKRRYADVIAVAAAGSPVSREKQRRRPAPPVDLAAEAHRRIQAKLASIPRVLRLPFVLSPTATITTPRDALSTITVAPEFPNHRGGTHVRVEPDSFSCVGIVDSEHANYARFCRERGIAPAPAARWAAMLRNLKPTGENVQPAKVQKDVIGAEEYGSGSARLAEGFAMMRAE